MDLLHCLDLKLLVRRKEQEQTLLATANTFFLLLKIPKIPLKMKSLKLLFHCANRFAAYNPISCFFFIISFF